MHSKRTHLIPAPFSISLTHPLSLLPLSLTHFLPPPYFHFPCPPLSPSSHLPSPSLIFLLPSPPSPSSFLTLPLHRWELSTLEISLLSLFLSSLPPAFCRDIPVYLPRASNKVAHRLLVFTLLEGIEVSVLCGPEPPMTVVQGLVEGYWSGMAETLRGCSHTFPRCVPLGLNFEPSVLAFCLVNLESCRCLTSLKPSTSPESLRSTLTAGTYAHHVT